ncbi:prolyl 4-hydroxylase subunit alpha-1-like [Triplophysa dalaica]|uniref:prolyl 4-hydroxylase subunit alpha-1-like n=1 Tax=Triplophysa dalaica TaxID=1582913 RepID=UPI0024E00233|nr:prolyl 4-hydroxylase subunit alpha-1-like [Triplophysa dalaica]
MVITKLLLFVASVCICSAAGHEFFSSTDQVIPLVEEERTLLKLTHDILAEAENLESILEILKLFEDPAETINDPAAAYKLIKRLRSEWFAITSRRQRMLSCRYSTEGGNPRLILAPLKEEIEWDEPRIVRYHDMISDKEIEILKNLSRPYMTRSQTGSGTVSNIRISQSVFLTEDNIVVVQVNQRIADATGLSMETAEHLNVQNYGTGGRYEPHYDALDEQDDRIGTFLIYMNDVEIGGATVFPKAGVALQPKKGSAVFWYNLHKNGDVDLRTEHAGCPVLRGNKWVANKWIHEFGQEFTRPCSLSRWE